MATLLFDVRDALRRFRRDRSYAATVVITLALTIGASTAMFSIVDGVLLKPLAYHESHQLVWLRETWRQFVHRAPDLEVNERHFEYWRARATSFASMAQYTIAPANLVAAGEPAPISVVQATPALFDVLQVTASLGRVLASSDEPTGHDVAVLSDRLWRQRFGADPSVVGRSITIDGRPFTVVGVLGPDVRIPRRAELTADFDAVIPRHVDATRTGWVGDHNNVGVGRLRPGVTAQQARAELDVLQGQVSAIATDEAHEPVTLGSVVTPLTDAVVGQSRRGLVLLFGAILAVLLIACSNLANLSLTRTLARLRDGAIRSALGASRARLVAGAVIEQLTLAAAGGALGIWVARAALAVFVRTAPIGLPRVDEVRLDARVLLFAAATSTLVGLVVALMPAWRIASRDVQTALRSGGAAVSSERGGLRARSMLLSAQVALSVVLLVVTSLLAISFVRVMRIDRGFDAERVLAVDVTLPASRYQQKEPRLAAYDGVIAAVQQIPGVAGVTTTSMAPLAGEGQINFIVPDGAALSRAQQPTANFRFVAPGFFRTLGVPILRGRAFREDERDPARPAPVVVSAPTAERLWPGQDPIGRRFSRGEAGEQSFEVVGIAADARMTSLERQPPLMVYAPYWWRSWYATSLLVRSNADPSALAPAIRRAVRSVDPEIALGEFVPVERIVTKSMALRRYQTQLFVAFGAVALFIAIVGVYAVTAYGVSRRRREMNIRVALGAQPSQVFRLVVAQGARPVIAGVVAGAAGAIAAGQAVSALLFGVTARDPGVIAGVLAVVAVVGVSACATAARQGLTIDPAAALREE